MVKPHAVVFPIPLQGHINPMMMLAKDLNLSGIRVTLFLTERTLSMLQKNNSSKDNIDASCKDRHLDENGDIPGEGVGKKPIIDGDDKLHHPLAIVDSCHQHNSHQDSIKSIYEGDATKNRNIHNNSIFHRNIQSCHQDDEGECANLTDIPLINFETLPDSSSSHVDHSLPMSDSVLLFLNSMPLIKTKVEDLLEGLQQKGHPATCIISDSFVPWTQDVANRFNIPRIEFWSSSVTVYSMGYHIPQLINGGYLPVQPGMDQRFCVDIIPGLSPFRLVDFFYTHAISSPVFDLVSKAFSRAKEAKSVLVNSFYDLEKDIIEALRIEGVSIEPIGPLIPWQARGQHAIQLQRGEEIVELTSTSLYADDHDDCLAWLDAQVENSVIYVSFGSMVSISDEEMQELMWGLEASQQPYLLVVRPGMVSNASKEVVGGRGRICRWAPQTHVLGHPAVAGFLTHCGWNSIMEGMCMGVPMIGCPRESEQHTNMKCLRDAWKVAIGLDPHLYRCQKELADYKESPTNGVKIKKDLVERAVRALMQEEIGVALRTRMKSLRCAALRAARMKTAAIQSFFERR